MNIISFQYAALVLVASFIYYFLKLKQRIPFLAILSSGFMASFSLLLLGYVFIFSFFNYLIGARLTKTENKKLLFRTGIVLNLIQLILFKYSSFAIDPIFQLFHSDIQFSVVSDIFVPLGISYFTLQGIGYLININKGWEKPKSNFIDFFIYIAFFPKFLSGPIERSNHFLPQLKKNIAFSEENVLEGLRTALFGFFKKIAIANQLAPFVFNAFENIDFVDGLSLWLLLLLLPLYLYFDFSGYTDIAIGFSKIFGINLLPNFNRPFFAQNVTTFWKRFHISLSSWFSDYIFKQTMFKRRKWGTFASVYALLLTWVLFGIWHGAGWNFMLLGFLQAIAIIYEFFTKRWRMHIFSKIPEYPRKWIGRIATYFFYGASLVFFFSPDVRSTFAVFSKLFTFNVPFSVILINLIKQTSLSVFVFMFIVFLLELLQEDYKNNYERLSAAWNKDNVKGITFRWTIYSIILAILFVLGNNVQPFIYSQF